ncbi:MAG: CDP-glycerol glycerophosphotransferase family protein [Desulfobacterales bacterium]
MKQPLFFSAVSLRETYHFFALMFSALVATVFFLPLSLVIPKKKGRIVVIGRERGTFSDNTKHFFLFLQGNTNSVFSAVFLSSNRKTIAQLRRHFLPCLFYPSLRGLYWLLTAEFIIMDNAEWISGGKFQLTAGSKLIQLWHGAPLKEIELPMHQRRLQRLSFLYRLVLQAQKKIIGRYPDYYAIVSTSEFFTQKVFSSAFRARHFVEYGYPRNDAILKAQGDSRHNSPIWINCDMQALQVIDKARDNSLRTILYAPTFRSDLSSPFSEHLSLQDLNNFASAHKILLVMKLHPYMANQVHTQNLSHIVHYAPECDIYPALSLIDCLVTDYSSIYFDYLLLDRPIIFFPYDFDHYIADERKLLFDYIDMAPGQLCKTRIDLQSALSAPDTEYWATRRNEVRNKVFNHLDDKAGQRLYNFLRDKSLQHKGNTMHKGKNS